MTPSPHSPTSEPGTLGHANANTDAGLTIRTVDDLRAILAGLPPQMLVTLDPVLRAAPGLSPEHHPQVVIADPVAFTYADPRVGGRAALTPALQLGARLVPEPAAPLPQDAYPCDPLHRMAEAFDAGDLGDGLRAIADALCDTARQVANEGTAWLPPASPLVEEFAEVADRLRRIATDLRSSLAPTADAELRRAEYV